MKIRKIPKILATPKYKNIQNSEYSRVMLYFPIDREENITSDSLSEMFLRRDPGAGDTIVRDNERYIFNTV